MLRSPETFPLARLARPTRSDGVPGGSVEVGSVELRDLEIDVGRSWIGHMQPLDGENDDCEWLTGS